VATSKTVNHAPASAVVVETGAASVTITSSASSLANVFIGTNPMVAIQPWYGVSLAPGKSAVFGVQAGQSLYTSAPSGPATLSVSY
jgi:hypothetical protein